MKFKKTLTSRATIKKSETYDFSDFTDEEIAEARKRDYLHPLYLNRSGCLHALYQDDQDKTILCIVMFHSYDKFKELKEDKK